MPFATKTLARDNIMSIFTTAWNAQTPPIPKLLYDDRKQEKPKDGNPYARIKVAHATGGATSIGGDTGIKRHTHVGTITVQVFSVFGEGLANNDVFTQVALDAFQNKSSKLGGMLFRNARSIEIGQTGAFYQTNVLVDFEYDQFK